MSLSIRKEVSADFKSVFEINQQAFKQDSEARLVETLRKSDAFVPGLSLVAILKNEIVGHILFTRIKIINENGESESLALAPMAVKPGFQNQGIGGELIRKGLEEARKSGFTSVIVLGHTEYYPKFGFVPTTKWNIKAPFEVPENAFMGIELIENGLKNRSGTVRYSKEFDNL